MPSPTDGAATTSLACEFEEQRRWQLRAGHAHVDWFSRLVDAEFLSPEEQAVRAGRALQRMLAYARAAVPWYRQRLAALGARKLADFALADLPRLPVLERIDLREQHDALRTQALPPGERLAGATRTSGTTGQPVQVWHTEHSLRLQMLLGQRQLRWFRCDPQASFAAIKLPAALPRDAAGALLEPGASLRLPTWSPVGTFFTTGPYLCFAATSPIDAQLAWLHAERPDYVIARAAVLEHLAFAAQDGGAPPCRGLIAIADQVTPAMRTRIEEAFACTLHQNYGLNEMGLVAVRCAAGGRYHVHGEHCVHEIVDEAGHACRPGERGRLLLTCLSNPAMPLLRYDTGDLAVVAEGPCPCGRTLPAFADICGRRLHLATLPPDTYSRREVLRAALDRLPLAAWRGIHQYQIRHARDESFTVLLATRTPVPTDFESRIRREWDAHCPGVTLHFDTCASIPTAASGKFQEFVSDYFDARH